jgi:hypothetical protein
MTNQLKPTAELIAWLDNEMYTLDCESRQQREKGVLSDSAIEHNAVLTAIKDRLAEQEAALTWQPIETAPKDGFFLVHENGCIRTMFRFEGEWQSPAYAAIVGVDGDNIVGRDAETLTGGRKLKVCDQIWEPTHWMPLPASPKATQPTTEAK